MAQITSNSPLARVRAAFGSKKELIEKVKSLATSDLWIDRLNPDKSWGSISNAKLLHLHAVLSEVKERFGSRDKLIDALLALEGRTKDADYRKRFASWPTPRLLDAFKSAERRKKKAEKKAEKKAAASTAKAQAQ